MAEILFCNKCGTANAPGALFCSNCGASMNPAANPAAGATPTAGAGTPYATQAGAYQPVASYPVTAVAARYGGFWIRVVAAIIDGIILSVVIFPIAAVFGISGMAVGGLGHMASPMFLLGLGLLRLIMLAGGWLYEAFMESSSYQATLGKMAVGLKVTDLAGNRISFERATGRFFAKILSSIFMIGFIMAGFTERKQGLHDLLAGTVVRRP